VSRQVEFIVADLTRFTEGELVALALNVDANLRSQPPQGTPVRTGWAAANWVPSVGAPMALPAADTKDPTPAQIAAARQAGRSALNEVLAYKLTDGPIFVSNGVPYIVPLNDGHSPQSPPGFVQTALEQAVLDTALASMEARSARGLRGREL
jgi:hypothetical protein